MVTASGSSWTAPFTGLSPHCFSAVHLGMPDFRISAGSRHTVLVHPDDTVGLQPLPDWENSTRCCSPSETAKRARTTCTVRPTESGTTGACATSPRSSQRHPPAPNETTS
ncbi:hypothetical protein CW362_30520 [Streptomyces populi]|uniref:Uncharacterized protein n=1 Tax=Streptomyces populi TaxID=2058924 RepID=A0A2I0SH58_9ACTN|nr:hypothetical protein CW362_30520 [Streptomyces populi]